MTEQENVIGHEIGESQAMSMEGQAREGERQQAAFTEASALSQTGRWFFSPTT